MPQRLRNHGTDDRDSYVLFGEGNFCPIHDITVRIKYTHINETMDKHSFPNLCIRIIHQKWNLGAWSLKNNCTQCLFNGAAPVVRNDLALTIEEMRLWYLAGAKGITLLIALLLVVFSSPSAIFVVVLFFCKWCNCSLPSPYA
jgi:hypothetical protein